MKRRLLVLPMLLLLPACGSSDTPAAHTSAPPPDPQPATSRSSSTLLYVTASALNVRATPSTTAAIVAKVSRGEALPSMGSEGTWTRVRTRDGVEGWVSSQHLATEPPADVATTSRRSPHPSGPCGEVRFDKTPVPSFSDAGKHGLVVVDATVDARGDVVATKVVSNTTGEPALATSTEREIRSAHFVPLPRSCNATKFIYTYKRSF